MPKPLTAAAVRSAKPGPAERRIHDGGGLYLAIKPSGARSWLFRGTVAGRRTNRGLGPVALVSLAEARIKALEIRRAIFDGKDPFAGRAAAAPTFASAADKVIAFKAQEWTDTRTEGQWRASLRDFAFPKLGARPVSAITTSDVLAVLEPIWTAKAETARRVRQRISAILAWAMAKGYRSDNPAGEALDSVLKGKVRRRHHESLPYADVPGALVKARAVEGVSPVSKLAFEFLALTAARSAEVREAVWDEVNMEARTWTIGAERMKARRPHVVPLSDRAMAILAEAREYREGDLVFPGAKRGRPMKSTAFTRLMAGMAGTPHGLRSSFRNWTAEQTDAPRAVCEAALAHSVKNATEAAYLTTDYLDQRRPLMAEWAAYLGKTD